MPAWTNTLITAVGVFSSWAGSVLLAWFAARHTFRNTQFTVRAQVKTTYRTTWLALFRDRMAELLVLGQQIHSPLDGSDGPTLDERRRLREVSAYLILLLGRGHKADGAPSPRFRLAEAVRAYSEAPSSNDERHLEKLAHEVFRERWDQISMETGMIDVHPKSGRSSKGTPRRSAEKLPH